MATVGEAIVTDQKSLYGRSARSVTSDPFGPEDQPSGHSMNSHQKSTLHSELYIEPTIALLNGVEVLQATSTFDLSSQEIEGTYTLQSKMLAVVSGVYGISNNITKRLTDSESLAAYETIHPLYIQVCMPF